MKTPSNFLNGVTERLRKIEADDVTALPDEALLKELKLLTKEGKLNQDAKRKLKQIFHLTRQIFPYLEHLFSSKENPQIVDVGAGKAYFGFILCDLLCKSYQKGIVTSIETRSELIQKCQLLAEKMNLGSRMKFIESKIEDFKFTENPDLLCALHACNTATDDAIVLGLQSDVKYFALVPCCQAELAQQLKEIPKSALWPLWRHPIHAREFGSHLTNVIRCLVLESRGYKVHVTEFTGWEHSLKNELIMAEKIQKNNPLAQRQLDNLLEMLPVKIKLLDRVANFKT